MRYIHLKSCSETSRIKSWLHLKTSTHLGRVKTSVKFSRDITVQLFLSCIPGRGKVEFFHLFQHNYWCGQHNFLLECCKTWKNLVFVGKYNSPKKRSVKHLSTKTYIWMLHYWCGEHNFNFLLKCWETWRNLAFVGKYNPLKRPFFQHFLTKVLHWNALSLMSAPQFSSKILQNLKELSFCRKV